MTTSLSEFNKSSAKFGHFLVKVWLGQEYEYEYGTKEKKIGRKFECYLLGDKTCDYMLGFIKGSAQQVTDAKAKFENGSVWKLSKPTFDTWTNASFISSSKPFRVALDKTTMERMGNDTEQAKNIVMAPAPLRTIAELTSPADTSEFNDEPCMRVGDLNE